MFVRFLSLRRNSLILLFFFLLLIYLFFWCFCVLFFVSVSMLIFLIFVWCILCIGFLGMFWIDLDVLFALVIYFLRILVWCISIFLCVLCFYILWYLCVWVLIVVLFCLWCVWVVWLGCCVVEFFLLCKLILCVGWWFCVCVMLCWSWWVCLGCGYWCVLLCGVVMLVVMLVWCVGECVWCDWDWWWWLKIWDFGGGAVGDGCMCDVGCVWCECVLWMKWKDLYEIICEMVWLDFGWGGDVEDSTANDAVGDGELGVGDGGLNGVNCGCGCGDDGDCVERWFGG